MANGFAVQFLHAHGKDGFAVEDVAGQSLPCVHARQRLCRAFKRLCRAIGRTAMAPSPVVLADQFNLPGFVISVRSSTPYFFLPFIRRSYYDVHMCDTNRKFW
jgi:hypothetical protein